MERYELAREKAQKDIQIADHMLTVTYKLVNDPKMLLAIAERILGALTSGIESVLHFERMYKRIPPFNEDFQSMFNMFKARCTRRYHINIEYLTMIQELSEMLRQHKESPIEFRRKDRFVICTENFSLRVLTAEQVKRYLEKAKLFLRESENMVGYHGRTAA